jgi:hypothetical protein
MLGFFGEIGCLFPQFPYISHSRGWSAEDMERNVSYVQQSESLHQAARELAARSVTMAKVLLATEIEPEKVSRGGRKGSQPMVPESPADQALMMEVEEGG